MKPFEIFRTGSHTPMAGAAIAFADHDLAAIASGYDPGKHQAPIVVGHPKSDAPAYGWVAGMHVSGDRLVATPSDVEASFADLVKSGRFKKVSASFYKPEHPANPTPGSFYLRHVGFLGAQPPAVKGLQPIEFSDGGDDVLTVEFSDWTVSDIASSTGRLFRRVRDFFIAEKGVETADELLPEWEIESLQRAGIRAEPVASTSYAEPHERKPMNDKTETGAADVAELTRRADELAAREAAFAERETKARAVADAALVAKVVEEGRLPKLFQSTAIALFAELDDETISFGEGDEAETTTPREAFGKLLASLPIPVETGERITGADGGIDFSDPLVTADLITTEIQAAKAKGQDISSATALSRLQQRAEN